MKPDIPEWAWDEASKVAEYINDTTVLHSLVMNAAARALLQARSQAFEECAKIADGYAVEPDTDEQDPYDEWEMGNRSAAKHISQAIRQHSQKGEDV